MPPWSGIDASAASAFGAGFAIAMVAAAIVFVALLGIHMLKRFLSAAGLL